MKIVLYLIIAGLSAAAVAGPSEGFRGGGVDFVPGGHTRYLVEEFGEQVAPNLYRARVLDLASKQTIDMFLSLDDIEQRGSNTWVVKAGINQYDI